MANRELKALKKQLLALQNERDKEKEYIKIKPQLPSVREIIVTVFPILFVVSIVIIEIKNRIQTYRRQRRRKRREKNR